MNDDRLTRYLSDQAEGIALPPADAAEVMRRGSRRRTRRRAGFVGGLAVVAVLAGTLAVRDPGTDQKLDIASAPNVAASTYDWSTVEPATGLGYGDRTAQLADGSIFAISTAPGPSDEDDPEQSTVPTLYRSQDGTEWGAATLPSGMRTADLAGAGDTLFGLGTAPAGGLVLASTQDGAASWTSNAVSDDLAALKARHGDKLYLGPVQVAAADASHLVVTAVATTSMELPSYRPEFTYEDHAWRWDDTGVTVYELEERPCEEVGGSASTRVGDPASMVCRAEPSGSDTPPGNEVARFSYDELGIVGELRDHVGGKAYAYASEDGRTFERVSIPADTGTGQDSLYAATPLATPDGYRMVLSTAGPATSSASILRSVDGRTWEHAGSLAGSAAGVGLLAGRPAVGLYDADGRATVMVEQGPGAWTDLDLSGAVVAPDGSEVWVGSIAFGPLGLATVVSTSTDDDGHTDQHLVHTTDGSTLEVVAIGDLVEGASVVGVVVGADAIAARVTLGSDDNPDTPPAQTVLVGTPTG